jgi:hypothetical protein
MPLTVAEEQRMSARTFWRSMFAPAFFALAAVLIPATSRGADEVEPVAPTKDAAAAKADAQLAVEQAKLADKFKELERVLLRMAEVTQTSDPKRAAILRDVFKKSKERQVGLQFEDVVKLLENEKLYQASKNQVAIQQDLNRLLELLLTGDRDKQIPNEKAELKKFIEKINRLIREEQGVQGQTEGAGDEAELAKQQDSIAKKTKELEEELKKFDDRNQPASEQNADGKPSDRQSAEQKPGGKKTDDKEGKQSDQPENEKADQKSDQEKKSDADQKNAAGGSKQSDQKQGDQKSSGDQKSGKQDADQKKSDKKDGDKKDANKKDTEKKDSDKKDSDKKGSDKKQDQKSDSKQSDKSDQQQSDSKDSKDSKSQQQQKQGQQGQPQQSEESDSDNQQSQNQQQQNKDESPARRRVREAQERMQEAKRRLEQAKRRGASEEQQKAIDELQAAKADLEAILRQLREEEIERTLAMLEGRFRKMLQMQIEVYEGTVRLDRVPEDQRDRDIEIESAKLSRREAEITAEADRALNVLREEGSSAAFPEAVDQMREDMENVTARLARANIGQLTQGVEQDIVKALEEMIASLQKAQKEAKKRKGGGGGGGGGGGEQDQALVDQIAELKMIRALQMRVNTRTQRYTRMLEDGAEQAGEPDLVDAVRRLSEREERIYKTTRDIVVGRNK